MAADRVDSEIVTKFFVKTCEQQMNEESSRALAECILLIVNSLAKPKSVITKQQTEYNPLITGSVAEFYIRPMLSCVGDVDVMYYRSDTLAIPAGTAPPTQLPDEFDNDVAVCEIVDSKFPGYVYLVSVYLLRGCIKNDKYYVVWCSNVVDRFYMSFLSTDVGDNLHGPAIKYDNDIRLGLLLLTIERHDRIVDTVSYTDAVPCVRCLLWPTQAADWATRHRNYGWPDSDTVNCVVSNGCDVVQVAHRQCRPDERQCRLSFSRAEIVLLNSWMPLQQIVYHMLRVFVKLEQLTKDADSKLSNYHIKTLMLWACELKPRSWWIDNLDVVRICDELLHILVFWLNNAHCANYFITNCNLLDCYDNSYHTEWTARKLESVTEPWLAEWFINNYIGRCAQICPAHVSRLFSDVRTKANLQNAVSAVVDWRLRTSQNQHYHHFITCQNIITCFVSDCSITVRSRLRYMSELKKFDQRLSLYFIAMTFLHIARKTTQNSLRNELLDVLATTCLQSNDERGWLDARHSSLMSLSQAAMLMTVVVNNSRSTVQLIEIELSKAYLYSALRCKDSNNDSIYCLANVFLAVLYCTTRHYQMAIDHCNLVTKSQDHSQCSWHVVHGTFLPKLDDDIDNVLGLSVFYKYLVTAVLYQQVTKKLHYDVALASLPQNYLLIICVLNVS